MITNQKLKLDGWETEITVYGDSVRIFVVNEKTGEIRTDTFDLDTVARRCMGKAKLSDIKLVKRDGAK